MIENFYSVKITNESDLLESIQNIEFLVRHSKEYRHVLRYLKEDLELRYSITFPNIDFVDKKLSFEMHHIITLYDVVSVVGLKMLNDIQDQEGKYLLTFDIAKKVIELHLEDKLPLVMLSKTEHELLHSGDFELTKDNPCLHLGKSKEFLEEYKDYLVDSEKQKLIDLGIEETNERQEETNS